MATAAALVGVAAIAPSPTASGQSGQPAADVKAEGNVFTGGLGFNPAGVSVKVGQVVRWTNTDPVVPHTATENHGLWDEGGTYGQTPANPSGFGPGESRQRTFEAGTQHYYCRVHPTKMHGVVAVPVTLARVVHTLRQRHRSRKLRYVVATWASATPAPGQVFDVQIMRRGGSWTAFRTGTRTASGSFRSGKRRALQWSVRARLRKASDPEAATDWSPVASIVG
jgi:plastocyanin